MDRYIYKGEDRRFVEVLLYVCTDTMHTSHAHLEAVLDL